MSIDPIPDEAAEPSQPRRRRLRWGRMVVLIVVVVAVVVGGMIVVPLVTKPHANASACHGFRSTYDSLIGTVAAVRDGSAERSELDAAVTALPGELEKLHAKSSGGVRVALAATLRTARAYATGSGTAQAAAAFYVSVPAVARACSADGSDITLRQLR